MGESALTGQLGEPLRGAPSCCVKASSPLVLASLLCVSAIGRWPAFGLTPNCYDLADVLVAHRLIETIQVAGR
eukprot:8376504-Alexandrium_andersonii.AAC.1